MARPFISLHFLLLLIILTSVTNMVAKVNGDCKLAVRGGGCPDKQKCLDTCRPCYRGVGQITTFCQPAGGGIPFDQCVCYFSNGASCNPPFPPQCPDQPPVM